MAESTPDAQPTPDLNTPALVSEFASRHPHEFARVLSRCEPQEVRTLLSSLPDVLLIPVLTHLSQEIARDFLNEQSPTRIASWMSKATIDESVRITHRLTANQRSQVLPQLREPRKKRVLHRYLALGKNTVGELADKDFMWFLSSSRVGRVRAQIQASENRDAVESAIIVNDDETVIGLLDYVSLTQAEDEALLSTCVRHTTLIPAHASPQAVVYLEDWHRVNRLPVVDQESMPMGVLRWGQIAELESETEETEAESFNIFYEMLDTMVELGKGLFALQRRQKSR